MWRSQGLLTYGHLKCASLVSLIASVAFLGVAFYIMHVWPISSNSSLLSYRKLSLLFGLASISWSAHIVHISIPTNKLLDSGVDPYLIVSPQDLLSRDVLRSIVPEFGSSSLVSLSGIVADTSHTISASAIYGYSETYGSLPLSVTACHHLYLGLAAIISGLLLRSRSRASSLIETSSSLINS
jgi:photosystem I P700 chlorophyll a apoprotein A1